MTKIQNWRHLELGALKRGGGGIFLLLTIFSFVIWASTFGVEQTVRAQGVVIPQERTQIVQVANGGVLKTLFVSEGDRVEEGQLLADLEDDSTRAGVNEVRLQIALLQVQRIRATAEAEFAIPDFSAYDGAFPDIARTQDALFQQNRQTLDEEVSALNEALELAIDEFEKVSALYEAGDIGKVEVTRAEREVIKARGDIASVRNKFAANARREVTEIEQKLATEHFKLAEREDALKKTMLRAPLGGVVKLLRVNTVGGVLRPGDELMQISPSGGQVIEAKFPPASVGQIAVGLPVNIRLDAFDYTIYGSLRGELSYLSSDTITEEDGEGKVSSFYKGVVYVFPVQENPKLPVDQLRPGMNSILDVQTGERTVLQFILKPILRAFSGALSEK